MIWLDWAAAIPRPNPWLPVMWQPVTLLSWTLFRMTPYWYEVAVRSVIVTWESVFSSFMTITPHPTFPPLIVCPFPCSVTSLEVILIAAWPGSEVEISCVSP